ncbi:MAG: hypothetical protein NVSMB22_15140 [Chloroflexota bacterium]
MTGTIRALAPRTACWHCGRTATSHDVLTIRGADETDVLSIHGACALTLAITLLSGLETPVAARGYSVSEQVPGLSPREWQVLEGIVRGERDGEIAMRLGIAEHTVKNHAYDMRRKVGARSRTEAAMRALHAGWVSDAPAGDGGRPT